ncbi:MAG: RNA polymerase sigma factor [Peptococcaceae bacterium]
MQEELELQRLLMEQPEQGVMEALRRYGKTVEWIVRKILGSNAQAEIEECVSDIFVKLWQNAAEFDVTRGVPLASWLYGIARHTALDYRRKQKRQQEQIPLLETDLQLEVDLDDALARAQNAEIVRSVVDALPPPDREIFICRYFLEMPVKAIAEQLKLTPKQVENKLYREKGLLQKQLLEKGVVR